MENKTQIIAEAGKQEITIIREFEAPRNLLFEAFTKPEYVVKFMGPDRLRAEIDYFDMRSGGSYRYVHYDDQGNSYGFHGAVHEVTAPERVIQTFEFEGMPERGHVSLDTSIFEDLPGGRSRLTIHSILRSVEDRDGMLQSGMETGMNEGFARLDRWFESLNQTTHHS